MCNGSIDHICGHRVWQLRNVCSALCRVSLSYVRQSLVRSASVLLRLNRLMILATLRQLSMRTARSNGHIVLALKSPI